MPTVTANGLTFSTTQLGEGMAERAPVAMVHGLLVGSSASWYFTSAPALARLHRVLLYDLRGHGKSERVRSGYDVATMAADLEAVASASLGNGPIGLVGHSYGALVALRFALDHPERVCRLALVEAPLPPSRMDELKAFLALQPGQMVEALPAVMQGFLGRRGRQADRLMRSLQFLLFESSLISDLCAEPDVADEALARLPMPVLCVYGRPAGAGDSPGHADRFAGRAQRPPRRPGRADPLPWRVLSWLS